jgi:hypothetical protein
MELWRNLVISVSKFLSFYRRTANFFLNLRIFGFFVVLDLTKTDYKRVIRLLNPVKVTCSR